MAKRRRTPATRPETRSADAPAAQPALWDQSHAADEGSADDSAGTTALPRVSEPAEQRPAQISSAPAARKRPQRSGRGPSSRQAQLREQAQLLDRVAERRDDLEAAQADVEAARRAWMDSVRAARRRHVIMDDIAEASGITRAALYQNLERDSVRLRSPDPT